MKQEQTGLLTYSLVSAI